MKSLPTSSDLARGRAEPPDGAPAPAFHRNGGLYPSSLPPGWRAEDVLGQHHSSGLVSIEECAEIMGIAPERVVALAQAGLLYTDGSRVRPAILSLLAVMKNVGGGCRREAGTSR